MSHPDNQNNHQSNRPLNYQALARQWRPRSFADMVGQETIVRIFTNALTQQRIHHAYLLTGTRGVGKTTLARIFAKCLNCEKGVTPEPCGTCATCLAIDAGRALDLYEIDAASRTKVEDTRELLDNVLYPPTQCRYKIYLIDEVHMLSNHSFNALLKTLEEPPAHVKFILATTDPKRLPITVLSRCLQFHLNQITPVHIEARLAHICAAENIATEPHALTLLAKAANGSMRDALSLLDQAIAYGYGAIKDQEVQTMLGSLTEAALLPLLEALADQSGEALFGVLTHWNQQAIDYEQALTALLDALHKMALLQMVPTLLPDEIDLKALAARFTPEDLQLYYQIALLGRRDLKMSALPSQTCEMTLLRMLAFKPLPLDPAPHAAPIRKNALPAPAAAPTPATPPSVNKAPAPALSIPSIPTPSPTPSIPTPSAATNTTITSTTINWRTLVPQLNLTGMTHALAVNCSLEKCDEHTISLALASNHKPMLNAKLKERLTEALNQHFQRPIQLDIQLADHVIQTPQKQAAEEHADTLKTATTQLMADPYIKEWVNLYDATVSVSLTEKS